MIKTIYFTLFVCAFAFFLYACSDKAKDNFKNLSADEFERLIEDENIQCVDVRTVAEYSEGHVPHSININVLDESFETMADSTLQKDKPVAVYCRSGKRSKKAAAILSKKGYIIYDLDKGFIGWEEAGKEVEK